MGRAITESTWRNTKPYAPLIEVDAYRGQPLDISLKGYLVQGARDMGVIPESGTPEEIEEAKEQAQLDHDTIIEEKKARRGWACNYFNISRPKYGRLSKSMYGDGFRYTAMPTYIGEDCFSYVINNSFQNSEPGQIIINVRNYMEGRIIIEEDTSKRHANRRAFRYVAQWYIPPEFGTFSHVVMTWFQHRPQKYLQDGGERIRHIKEIVSRTTLSASSLSSAGYRYVRKNYTFPSDGSFIETTWPDSSLAGVVDDSNGSPYQQPAGPFPLSVEISFRRQKVEQYTARIWRYNSRYPIYLTRYRVSWEDIESVETDVRDLYGNGWWRDGRIQNIHDPNFTPSAPGTFVPLAVSGQ